MVYQQDYISSNELETAKKEWESSGQYEIHRVYNVGMDSVNRKIYNSIDSFDLEELVYKVTLKDI